jgi:hypothetical protein
MVPQARKQAINSARNQLEPSLHNPPETPHPNTSSPCPSLINQPTPIQTKPTIKPHNRESISSITHHQLKSLWPLPSPRNQNAVITIATPTPPSRPVSVSIANIAIHHRLPSPPSPKGRAAAQSVTVDLHSGRGPRPLPLSLISRMKEQKKKNGR